MHTDELLQKIWFNLRVRGNFAQTLRRTWWSLQGARFGRNTRVPKLEMSWPHQVQVGDDCILESDILFKFDGIWQSGPSIIVGDRVFLGKGCEFNIRRHVQVANDCLVASGCKFIDHNHGSEVGTPMNQQHGPEAPIVLAEDVWLGCNVVVLKGVTIGRGAIIGTGAVVTKSVPPFEIWAGIPARKIGERVKTRNIKSHIVAAQQK